MSNPTKNIICRPSSLTLISTSKRVVLPLDIILHMSKYLKLEDYRRLVKSIWPNGDEDDNVRAKLWHLSTHQFTTRFINGKQIDIKYNYDPSRMKEDQTLFDMNSLLPLFGGIAPPAVDTFTSISRVHNFIDIHVNLDMCSDGQHASCRCQQMNDGDQCTERAVRRGTPSERPPVECKRGHFHHYCSQHVKNWLNFYLAISVLLRETGNALEEDETTSFLRALDDAVYLRPDYV